MEILPSNTQETQNRNPQTGLSLGHNSDGGDLQHHICWCSAVPKSSPEDAGDLCGSVNARLYSLPALENILEPNIIGIILALLLTNNVILRKLLYFVLQVFHLQHKDEEKHLPHKLILRI